MSPFSKKVPDPCSTEIFCQWHSKKCALNQNNNTNILLAEMLEIALTP